MIDLKTFANSSLFQRMVFAITGVLFLFSLYSKLIGIETFEVSIYASGIPFKYRELVSRLILIIEAVIGVWLFVSFFTKDKISIVWAFFLLLFFDFILLKDILFVGDKENCGCFGDLIEMSSSEAFVKNIGFQLLMLPIIIFGKELKFKRLLIGGGLLILTSISIMVVYPIDNFFEESSRTNFEIPIEETKLNEITDVQKEEVYQDNQFLIFAHYNCDHCRKYTKYLKKLKDQGALEKCRILLYGTEEKKELFLKATSTEIPITMIDKEIHLGVCGGRFPTVYLYRQDTLCGVWLSNQFEPVEILAKYGKINK